MIKRLGLVVAMALALVGGNVAVSTVVPASAATRTVAVKALPPRSSTKAARLTGCTTCFYYGVGSQDVSLFSPAVTGASTLADIYKPTINTAKGDVHSLAELAVQDNSGNVIELGWNVDQSVNGDLNTHLFTYYWVAGVPQGYNTNVVTTACGVSSPPVTPGQALVSTGSPILLKQLTIQHSGSYWYLAYGGTNFGCFADTLFGGSFTTVKYFQEFGEVSSTHDAGAGVRPCAQMGSGVDPNVTTTGAARFGNTAYIGNTTTPNLYIRQDVGSGGTVDTDYTVKTVNTRSFYYGGHTSAVSPTC